MPDDKTAHPDNFAAIVPLDYGPDREELSLIFASYDWMQLPELLKDPAKFFQDQSQHWEQDPAFGTKHDWKLLTPSTVILQWVGKTQAALDRSAQVAAHTVPEADQTRRQSTSELTDHFGDTADLVGELRKNFSQGFFVAEFAFKTRILFVRYHPAEVRRNEKNEKIRHFQGQFTNATANKLMPVQDGRIAASVHIDVGQTKEDRAHFVMDFIEDCEEFFTEALQKAPTFFTGDVPLVQKHGTIQIKTCSQGRPPRVKMANDIPFPTIYMETPMPLAPDGMKDDTGIPADCLVCVMSNGQWLNPQDSLDAHVTATYVVDNTIVKCYAPPSGPSTGP